MPDSTSAPDLTLLHLVNCIRTSPISSPSASAVHIRFASALTGLCPDGSNRRGVKHLFLQSASKSRCPMCVLQVVFDTCRVELSQTTSIPADTGAVDIWTKCRTLDDLNRHITTFWCWLLNADDLSASKPAGTRKGDRVAPCVLLGCVTWRKKDNMPATESVRRQTHQDFGTRENGLRELQDVLSRYLPRFHSSAYRHLGNVADAEDAVQDALLAGYKHLDQFKGDAQLSTWLTSIVTNCARMQLRRRPHQAHLSLDEPTGEDQEYYLSDRLAAAGPSPEEECHRSLLHERLLESVAQLSPSLRRAFQLRDLEGLSVKEAARTLGLSEGTVKAQLSRARAKLTRLMRQALRPVHRSVLARTPSRGLRQRSRISATSAEPCTT